MVANNTTDLKNGVVGEVGCKYPATVASLTNITLEGLQTINGVSVTDEMIVVVKGQTDKTENGIYIPSTGEWQRAVWFDDELDAAAGTLVFTSLGTSYSNTLWRTVCADSPIVFGTSEIDFEVVVSGNNTGDVTLTGQNYLTLVNQVLTANKISLSNMANLAANSFIGNNTGSAVAPIALTITQATAALNAMVGDSGSGGTKGLVPAPAAGDAVALKFLKADGTWQPSPTAGQATETVAGIQEIATQAETNALTDDQKSVTPLKLGFGFSILLAENGYIKFPSWLGGLTIQWGTVAVAFRDYELDLGAQTFPIPFNTACLNVSVSTITGEAAGFSDNMLFVSSKSTTSFNLLSGSTVPATRNYGAFWLAFGY